MVKTQSSSICKNFPGNWGLFPSCCGKLGLEKSKESTRTWTSAQNCVNGNSRFSDSVRGRWDFKVLCLSAIETWSTLTLREIFYSKHFTFCPTALLSFHSRSRFLSLLGQDNAGRGKIRQKGEGNSERVFAGCPISLRRIRFFALRLIRIAGMLMLLFWWEDGIFFIRTCWFFSSFMKIGGRRRKFFVLLELKVGFGDKGVNFGLFDCSCFVIGTRDGFRIFDSNTGKLLYERGDYFAPHKRK